MYVTEHHSKLTKSVTRCASISTVKVNLMDKKVAHWSCEVKTDSWVKRKQLYVNSYTLEVAFCSNCKFCLPIEAKEI